MSGAAGTTPADTRSRPAPAGRATRAFVVGVAMLFVSAGALSAAIAALKLYTRKLPIQAALKCPSLPGTTEHWEQAGADHEMSEATLETLGTHNFVDRTYVERTPKDPRHPRVANLHLAYYTGAVDTVPHVPERCMVAAGQTIKSGPYVLPIHLERGEWSEDGPASGDMRADLGVSEATVHTARLGPGSRSPGSRVRLPRGVENLEMRITEYAGKGDRRTYAGYFFIANGALTSSAQNVRLLAFDLRSDYAYYMKVQVSADWATSEQELADVAGSLLSDVMPDVMLCVPDWTEVIRGEYPPDNPRRKKGDAGIGAGAGAGGGAAGK